MSHTTNNNDEYRCPKCSLVPFIELSTNENKLFMSTKCINNHCYSKLFEEMQNLCKKSPISNCFCETCENENKENKNKLSEMFYYCTNCFKFYCLNHGKSHNLNDGHNIFLNNNLDSICFEHNGTTLVGYCSNHNKNYCIRCNHYYENNKKIDEEFDEEQIKIFKDEMKKNEEIIKNFEILFDEYFKMIKKLEEQFYFFKQNMIKKINFMNEIINFYNIKTKENNINYQMKSNIGKNYFDLTQINEKIINNLNSQTKEINELIKLLKMKEFKSEFNFLNEFYNFKDFKFENMNNFQTLNYNEGFIYCLKTLVDGRLASSDSCSNLIIYNKLTFKPEIIIQNNLSCLFNFIQLKNKNLACLFDSNYTIKIIKIKNNNEYEDIQIIKNAHNNDINKIIELKNENLITFSWDYSFKIWKLNFNDNKYEKINEFKDSNILSDGLEIKDNEILYSINTNPQSLIFYNLNKNEKIKTLNNLNLIIDFGNRIIQLTNEEIAVAGEEKIYLIDINNYLILHEIITENFNYCILKLSNDLFLIGDSNGTIAQFKIENKKIIKESWKNKSHNNRIFSMTILNDMIISGDGINNEIIIWKK